MQSGGRFPRMGMRAVGVLASWVVLALLPNLAVSLEPPRRGELKQYQEDDSLARRVEFSKRLMNHRFRAALVQRKAAQLQAIREGKPLPDAILPYEVGLPSSGAPKIFALLIDFSDYPSVNNVDSFQSKLFGTGDPSEFPVESLTEFYKRSSYGVLDIGGVVLGWYRARYSRDYYGAYDYSSVAELIKEALATFENSHDFTQYDNNGDGEIDYFCVFWTGPDTGWASIWWGWSDTTGSIFAGDSFRIDGKRLGVFSWQWESRPVGEAFSPLVIIHETGHALGLPDYYDYLPGLGPEGGLGGLDMMDTNEGDHNAFSKWMLDWVTPTVIGEADGVHSLTFRASADYPDCAVIMPGQTLSDPFAEYFVVQNRFRVGNDEPIPGDGLLIWHVDARLNGAGNDFEYDNSYTDHKLIRLMEADGREDIESGWGIADLDDFYDQGDLFSPVTSPNSNDYAGNTTAVAVANISAGAATMTADLSLSSFMIAGHVRDANGAGVEGVLMQAGEGVESVTTDAQGYYELTVSLGWSGTVMPSRAGWVFAPAVRDYTQLTTDQSDQDFTASDTVIHISGYVSDESGAGLDRVTLSTNDGRSTATDANGAYSLAVPPSWTGTVTAVKVPWQFEPPTRSYNEITSDQADQSYTGSVNVADWTIMIYLDADNDLESPGIEDFLEMAEVGSDANVNIVVQFDRIDGYDTSYGNWTGTKRFLVTQGMTPLASNAEEDLGEVNMGDPQTLIDFVIWAKENYPADNYTLVLWNHGGGWRNAVGAAKGRPGPVRSVSRTVEVDQAVCWDETSGGDSLYMSEVQFALSESGPVDVLGFDACTMGMIEVAYQLIGHADVMVASEELEPIDGWPYDTFLADLVANPSASAGELGTMIVTRYMERYPFDPTVTQSAIDLAQIPALAVAVDTLGRAIVEHWQDADKSTIQTAAGEVMDAMDSAVIAEGHNSFHPDAHGLSIYFPFSAGAFDSDYNGNVIDFPRDTYWDEFLSRYYASMIDSWITICRIGSESFDVGIDLYHFAERLTDPPEQTEFYVEDVTDRNDFELVGTPQGWWDDDWSWSYTLPFAFTFFGETYNEICVSSNGYVTFGEVCGFSEFWNPLSSFLTRRVIAPLWDDLRTDGFAQSAEDIYVDADSERVIITWIAETFFRERVVNVGLVLWADGTIEFRYGRGNSVEQARVGISAGDMANYYLAPYDYEREGTNLYRANTIRYVPRELAYTLTATVADGYGRLETDLPGDIALPGQIVHLTAIPDENYRVQAWTGTDDDTSQADTNTVTMTENKQVTVQFERDIYPLTVEVIGGHGSVLPTSGVYDNGTVVTLTAAPEPAYRVKAWAGTDDDLSKADTNTVTMAGPETVTVEFELIPFLLTAKVVGGQGTISTDPAGPEHAPGTAVTVTVVLGEGYRVQAWTGTVNNSSRQTTNTVIMIGDKVVTVVLELIPCALELKVVGSGTGSLISEPAWTIFDYGAAVRLVALPDEGCQVKTWTGTDNDASKDTSNTVTMRGDKTVTVEFELRRHSLDLVVVGEHGALAADPVEADHEYEYGTQVILIASPNESYRVKAWRGTDDDGAKTNTNKVTVKDDRTVTVEFEKIICSLKTVVTGGPGVLVLRPVTKTYDYGAVITLIAIPDFGYRVKTWSGTDDDISTKYSNTITLTGDHTVTAEYVQIPQLVPPVPLTVSVVGGHGSVEPGGGIYDLDKIVVLTATPDPGYRVKAWSGTDNDTLTESTSTITMDAGKTVTVEFELVPATVPGEPQPPPTENPLVEPTPVDDFLGGCSGLAVLVMAIVGFGIFAVSSEPQRRRKSTRRR